MKKSLIVIAAIMLMATGLMAQNTETTTAGAKIVSALTVSNDGVYGLHFGTMSIPATAATVTVPPTGARTSTGTITLLGQAPTYAAAGYTLTGDGNSTFTITLPSSAVNLTSGANSMTVTNFLSSIGTSGALTSGTGAFTVGGTLNLANGQAAGTYAGTFNVSVAYN